MAADIVRDTAVFILLRVFQQGVHLDAALDRALRRRKISERGRRFLTHLVYGTVRHRTLCDHILARIVNQPIEDLPRPIHIILRMGVFQALFSAQVTFPAMVHTSVDLAKKHGHAGTARLVNAVLKRVPQSLDAVDLPSFKDNPTAHLAVCHSLPEWFVDGLIGRFGVDEAQALCEAFNEEAPVALRVNTLKMSPDELQRALAKADCITRSATPVPEELTVASGRSPLRTKLFQAGHFMLQDPASMLPPHLLDPQPGERILDLCAAPGGKATHIAQLMQGQGKVVAADVHARKLRLVRENAERLGTPSVVCLCADGTQPPFAGPSDGPFDRVLVDAPCSGWGTLRRHPDLKWRLHPGDPASMSATQQALLRSAIRLCKNGGVVVYSVCTFSPEETEGVVEAIVREHAVVEEDGPEWMSPWRIGPGRYLLLPHKGGEDGFFLTRLRKKS